jgi:hypothetical protein
MKGVATALLAGAAALSLSRPGAAQAHPGSLQDPACLSVVRRLPALVDREGCPLAAAAGAGYGYTEAVLGQGDSHHRLLGALGAEWAAHPALVLGLRLEGRYDRHQVPSGQDDGWTGEPRLYGRWERAQGQATRLALALGINLPGGKAPSIDFGAVGGDLSALATRVTGPLELTAKVGYRLDRAARALPEAARLSPNDRVGLGVSAFNAVLVGLSGEHRRRALSLFAEATLDALLGAPAAVWPLRLGAGARRGLGSGLAGELLLEAALSSRPAVGPEAPLIELPPRIALLAGLTWGRGALAPRGEGPPPPPPPMVAATPEPPTARGQLRGSVRSYGGRGIAATIHIAGSEGGTPTTLESRAGNFEVDLPPGSYEVRIEAPAFVSQRRRITIEENGVILLNVDLRRAQ